MRAIHKWNLNETEGRYARTGIVEAIVDLDLGLKRTDGNKEAVGRFRLPMDALADSGFVTRRVVDGHRVFDVQLYRALDGSYSLGVRRDETTPLTGYAMP
jgi:hypothetical protein